MTNTRKLMERLEVEDILPFAEQALEMADISPIPSEAELAALTKEELIDLLMQDDGDAFGELWGMANEDSESMHPDEDDEEFFEHEDPDKD